MQILPDRNRWYLVQNYNTVDTAVKIQYSTHTANMYVDD
jgi:hypothetical protein